MTGRRRLTAGAVLAVLAVTATGCDSSDPEPQRPTATSTAAPDCVGEPGEVHLLSGAANNVKPGLRLGITGIQLDADPPTAGISVIDGDPAGADVTVSVGDMVTFNSENFTVAQICASSVDLTS